MLSSGVSAADTLTTFLPPGTASERFNLTAVVYVADVLGSTTVTSLGNDGLPLTIVSTPPDEAREIREIARGHGCGSANGHAVCAVHVDTPSVHLRALTDLLL